MNALSFHDHPAFHRTVLRGTTAAALAGAASLAVESLGWQLPQTLLLGAAVAFATAAGPTQQRLVTGALGALAGYIAALVGKVDPLTGMAATGAALGLLFARARQESAPSPLTNRPFAFVASAAAAAALLALGQFVVAAFGSNHVTGNVLPPPLSRIVLFAVLGYFASLGAAGAHVGPELDPVEAAWAALEKTLTGDLQALCGRAVQAYRRCVEAMQGAAKTPAQTELARSLSSVGTRLLELAGKWQKLDGEAGDRAQKEIDQRLEELRKLKESTKDEVAKRQLAAAEASLDREREQFDRIRRARERIIARLHGDMALLERTRLSLLGLRSSEAAAQAPELNALASSLSAAAKEMDSEVEMAQGLTPVDVQPLGPAVPTLGTTAVKARA